MSDTTSGPNRPVTYLNPYAAWKSYRRRGWGGTLYLPYKKKSSPPTGFTGQAAKYPTVEELQQWEKRRPQQNICIRLAGVDKDHELFGIDVDDYIKAGVKKNGGEQLRELEAKLGPLPETWISSARVDGMSGIRYFRVPRDLTFKGKAAKDVDVICKGYHYAQVWPSIHEDNGKTVWWFRPGLIPIEENIKEWDGEIPDARTMPLLPEAWINYLTTGNAKDADFRIDNSSSVDEIFRWAEEFFHGNADTEPCSLMRQKLDNHKKKIKEESSSHPLFIAAQANIINLACEGHLGWRKAINEVTECFVDVCVERDKRSRDKVESENFRSESGYLRKKKARIKSLPGSCEQTGCSGDNKKNTGPSPSTGNGALPSWFSNSGQVRMAYRLVDDFGSKLIFVYGIGWHYWDKTRWCFDDRGYAKRAVLKVLKQAWREVFAMTDPDEKKRMVSDIKKCESSAGINGVLSIASALRPFANTVIDIDANPYLLNVSNGTLDLETMQLMSHDPEDKITKICRGAYDPEKTSNLWEAFLYHVLPDAEVRDYLKRIMGVALLGTVREHLLPILTGTGRNGKSVFYETMIYMLNDYAGVAEPDLFMHREGAHPTGEMDLRGLRLAVVSENDKDRRLAEATVKRLTGGDPIKARHMRQDFVTFQPSHLAMLITNFLPRVKDDDPAIWARLRVIPFEVVVAEKDQDKKLAEKLQDEIDAVLTWSMQGLAEYLRIGTAEPDRVRVATEEYRSASDDVGNWIAEDCVVGDAVTQQAQTTELHTKWKKWQRENGCPEMGLHAFGRVLDDKGYHVLPAVHGRRERRGIGLKDPVVRLHDVNSAKD